MKILNNISFNKQLYKSPIIPQITLSSSSSSSSSSLKTLTIISSALSSSETTKSFRYNNKLIKRKEVINNRYYSTTTNNTTTTTTTTTNTTSNAAPSNRVYSWGSGLNGKLGFGLFESKIVKPQHVLIQDDNNKQVNIENVTCGTTFSIFSGFNKDKDRVVFFGCGDNRDAQLIVGGGKVQALENIEVLESPVLLEQINGKRVKQLTSGSYHSACIFTDGTTLLWGASNSGQVGSDVYNRVQYDPFNSKVLFDIGIDKISLGSTFSIALSKDGKLYSFGSSAFNELGNGDLFNERVPKLINNQLIDSNTILDVQCGFHHSLALTNDNRVLTWGRNHEGQCKPLAPGIGKGSFTEVVYLDTSILENDGKITQIGTGSFNSYILTESGNIYSIGANENGQLGLEKAKAKKGSLNKVDLGDSKVKKFYTGFKSIIVESTDGRFFGWGSNLDHQLSLEKRANYFTPTELPNLNELNQQFKINQISISLSHCISLTSQI